jgi:thymidylate kinase
MQRLAPALREGATQSLILTGGRGSGKSVLATALARMLAAQGFMPVALPSTFHAPLTVARLLFTCAAALHRHNPGAVRSLADAHRSLSDRLEHLLDLLARQRMVLLLDRFDVNLDPVTRRIKDPWRQCATR